MHKCYFISDLHLFAGHSQGHQYLDAIFAIASDADTFVLGGDIFDFRWAKKHDHSAVARAISWLDQLASHCPNCQFHFVVGNHDYHPEFMTQLEDLGRRVPNLSWHPYYVRLGSNVFLHGDVAGRKMDARRLIRSRARWLRPKRRGPMLHLLYDLVVRTRIHRPIPYLVYPKPLVAHRILSYLRDIGHGPQDGVENVYFGHTHANLSNYCFGGLTFHNGGATIKGLDFEILEVATSEGTSGDGVVARMRRKRRGLWRLRRRSGRS